MTESQMCDLVLAHAVHHHLRLYASNTERSISAGSASSAAAAASAAAGEASAAAAAAAAAGTHLLL